MGHQVIAIFASEDEAYYQELDRALSSAKREGLAVLRSASAFADDAALASAIDGADVVLVLLTPALLDWSLWTGTVLQKAKEAREKNRTPVVPIVVEPCDWERTWLGGIKGLPVSYAAISRFREGEAAGWSEVATGLRQLFVSRPPRPRETSPQSMRTPPSGRTSDFPAPSVRGLPQSSRTTQEMPAQSVRGAVASPPSSRTQEIPVQSSRAAPPPLASIFDSAAPDLGTFDLAQVRQAYRLLERYHQALLRVAGAAERSIETLIGPLQKRSWAPAELHFPGVPARRYQDTFLSYIPLKRISYIWASTSWLLSGGCRVTLVHDGDASDSGKANAATSSTLSLFAVSVRRSGEQQGNMALGWESADRFIGSSPGFSPAQWEDGEVHLAQAQDMTFRFGGFSQEMARVLANPSYEPWLERMRALVSGVLAR